MSLKYQVVFLISLMIVANLVSYFVLGNVLHTSTNFVIPILLILRFIFVNRK